MIYSQRQFALYSMHMGPMFRIQSQLHFGVLSAGQEIWQVSLRPMPQETISHLFDPSASIAGSSFMMTGAGADPLPSVTTVFST